MTGLQQPRAAFESILVANRGEIALRITRTARALGYRVIAVYSEADEGAPHVRAAHASICLGAAPVADSYLNPDKVLQAISDSGAEAVHPGYGFLSENAAFVAACEARGVVFIGPSSQAVALMGNKAAAKRHMEAAGVPCIPGFQAENADDETLLQAAGDVGYPLMVKAAAGGGGRGMVRVESAEELPPALRSARSVAASAFADDELILERAIDGPRHVEVQVFADAHGNVIHLGERDCSTQRRHQKVIEEAPCPVMSQELRQRMGAAAVTVACAIDYCGAGTVEFLLDTDGAFYFLEMNTRLQVEHPVTEMITGLDLVALQLQVAQGQALGVAQAQVHLSGWAMEARLYAEEPAQGFLPRAGRIEYWHTSADARTDAGIEGGAEVSPFYDPMLAKIIVHATDRDAARAKLISALTATVLFGVQTNRDFLIEVLQQDAFVRGEVTTDFITAEYGSDRWIGADSQKLPAIAAVILCIHQRECARDNSLSVAPQLLNWSSGPPLSSCYSIDGDSIQVRPRRGQVFAVSGRGDDLCIQLARWQEHCADLVVDDELLQVFYQVQETGEVNLSVNGVSGFYRDALAVSQVAVSAAGDGRVLAPMHGVVQDICVSAGERVGPGQRLAVVEAMKMQHDILADVDGIVGAIPAQIGSQVAANDLLLEISPDAKE